MYLKADLSAETLQTGREWQDILKVLTWKNLQPRNPIQQASHSKLMEKSKDFQRSTKQTSNNSENGNRNKYINNYFKCQWITCLNQKT